MIGSLRGVVVDRPAMGELVVDVQGVGYRVLVPTSLAAAVTVAGSLPGATGATGATGDARGAATARGTATADTFLYVHTHVREDAIVLYGFAHADERRCFEALLGTHGVGPSLALAILSSLSPAALSTAVLEDDVATLCLVPGVGKKTAARLLLELKARLELPDLGGAATAAGAAERSSRSEVRAALAELGYGPDEIRGALDQLADEGPVEEQLRSALRELARSR